MDVAIAWFVRRALKRLAGLLASLPPAPQAELEADLLAVSLGGAVARVWAPHLPIGPARDERGQVEARAVLAWLFDLVDHRVPSEERRYRDLVADAIEAGSLSERILARLRPLADDEQAFTEAARRVWIELADSLMDNRPWAGRAL